jgi:SAM-dependent methyltransferase
MTFWERVRWNLVRQYYQARKVVLRLRVGEQWEQQDGVSRRRYPDYQTYLAHQKTKFGALRAKTIEGHDRRFHADLSKRLAGMPLAFRGRPVLCLAARQGSEVRAFIDQGAFAVGIDLNPGRKNPHVLPGDFHDLQFADESVDYVYTNSIDHAFDATRMLAEVHRVLKPDGRFIVEANTSSDDGAAPAGPYESVVWSGVGVLLQIIESAGFSLQSRQAIQRPWLGEQLVFAVEAKEPQSGSSTS